MKTISQAHEAHGATGALPERVIPLSRAGSGWFDFQFLSFPLPRDNKDRMTGMSSQISPLYCAPSLLLTPVLKLALPAFLAPPIPRRTVIDNAQDQEIWDPQSLSVDTALGGSIALHINFSRSSLILIHCKYGRWYD